MRAGWIVFLGLSCTAVASSGHADAPVDDSNRALAEFNAGHRTEALSAIDDVARSFPNHPVALYAAALLHTRAGEFAAGLPLAQRLTKSFPNYLPGWEVMIQLYQLSGMLEKRNEAIGQIHAARSSAMDRNVRNTQIFVRDRIIVGKQTLLVAENFDQVGETIRKWTIIPEAEVAAPKHVLQVIADDATTQQWREAGTLPEGKTLFHLESTGRTSAGEILQLNYEFYIDTVDYDRVRATVIAILNGKAAPMNGTADAFWAASTQ